MLSWEDEFDAAMAKPAAKSAAPLPPAMGSVASGFAAPSASQGLYQQAAAAATAAKPASTIMIDSTLAKMGRVIKNLLI